MKRFTSQLIYCSPQKLLKRTVIEQNLQNKITNLIDLDECLYEPAQTLIIDGIVSPEPFSLKENSSFERLNTIKENYNYIDLSIETVVENLTLRSNKKLILDFGQNNTETINSKLNIIIQVLENPSIINIICSCTTLPSSLAEKETFIKKDHITTLVNWTFIDFSTMRATAKTRIRNL